MDLMAEINPELPRMVTELLRLLHKALLSFREQIVSRPGPKAPWIPGRQLPAERHAPKHRHGFHPEFRCEVHQFQQILLVPRLNLLRREFRHVRRDERMTRLRPRPNRRMNPKRTMRRDAIDLHPAILKGRANLFRLFQPALSVAEHIVARLHACGTCGLGVVDKLSERFGAVLGTFDGSVVSVFWHSVLALTGAPESLQIQRATPAKVGCD